MVCIATTARAGDVDVLPLLSVTVTAAGDAEAEAEELDDATMSCELLLEPMVIGRADDSADDSIVSGESMLKK